MATMISGLGGSAGYGEQSFRTSSYSGNLDDGFTSINLTSIFGPTGMNFNGTAYTSMYLGTNGLATFNSGVTTYSPSTLTSLGQPVLAPFWTDIDISKGGEIYWDFDTANDRLIVTWLNVAPYSGSGTNSFQMVLTNTGAGDFNVEYIYDSIGFTNGYAGVATVGIASGGTQVLAMRRCCPPIRAMILTPMIRWVSSRWPMKVGRSFRVTGLSMAPPAMT